MPDMMDDQELSEREEAASRYAGEDQTHFVDYCIECARESRDSRKDILGAIQTVWDAYNNVMEFGSKESWQSKVITPKPFTAVERATSIIAKAFKNPNYITAEGVYLDDKDISHNVKEALDYWASPQKMDIPRKFTNASRMALAVGISMEMIPRWEDSQMVLDLTEPWKICRDPDALPGESQSGMYHIHEEWQDMWKIKSMSDYYINTDEVREGGPGDERESTKEEIERRKRMIWERSTYRKATLVREFKGVVLDKRGDLLLPNAKYTIACTTLIRAPEALRFVRLKWPETSFAPIPHILRYDGRGIIEGIFDLWKMLNNMLSLTMDDFSWVVNRMREVVPELFLDPTDLELYPGKDIYRSADNLNEPSVRDLLTTSVIDKILAVAQYMGTAIDNGDFVTEFVQGLPGTRSNITKGEVEIKTEQNMGIFDLIGTGVEGGAVNLAYSTFETMVLNWNAESVPPPSRVLGPNPFTMFLEQAPMEDKVEFLKNQCDIKIVGISAQIANQEKVKFLMAMKNYIESPIFSNLMKPRELLEETVGALGMYKAPFLKTQEETQQENVGLAITQALVKAMQSGDPETQQAIVNFCQTIGIDPQLLLQAGAGAEMQAGAGGGNGGGAISAPSLA